MAKVSLHKLAKTTPALREEIKNSPLSGLALAKKLNLTPRTVYKWKNRDSVYDKSHKRHNLLSSLSPVDEEIVVELRTLCGLSVDDVTEVMQRCINPKLTRSSIYRAMKRCGVAKRPAIEKEKYQKFEEITVHGHIHMDVKYLTKLDGKRSYLYVAIDRLTRYVYAEILYDLEQQTAASFAERFINQFPFKVIKIVTDNGFEWTDRCAGFIKNKATGNHLFDIVCAKNGIKHQLTKIRRPQTNGLVERFNRRVNDAIHSKERISDNGGKNAFSSHSDRNEFIHNFVYSYNRTRLICLNYKAPIELLNHNQTEGYTQAG